MYVYDTSRVFRNSLLCCAVLASASVVPIAQALDAAYCVGCAVDSSGKIIPFPERARTVTPPSSAPAGYPNSNKIPYGWRGTLRTSSRVFKQLWAIEAAVLVGDWIRSQYDIPEGYELTPDMMIEGKTKVFGGKCDLSKCYYYPMSDPTLHYEEAAAALQKQMQIDDQSAVAYYIRTQFNCNVQTCQAYYTAYRKDDNSFFGRGWEIARLAGGNPDTSLYPYDLYQKYPAGEPTREPDPQKTGEVIELPTIPAGFWDPEISANAYILDNKTRWRTVDPQGVPIKEVEVDLIRNPDIDPEPPSLVPDPAVLNPDPAKILPNPNSSKGGIGTNPRQPNPPPSIRVEDTLTGEKTTVTPNIEPQSVDLSRIEDALTQVGSTPADGAFPEPDLKSWDPITVEDPEASDEDLSEKAQAIRKVLTVDQVVQRANEIIASHEFELNVVGSTSGCPKPRKMRFLTAEIDLPFDYYCDFLKQIVILMIGLVPLGAFIYFLKNFFVRG